MGLEDGVSVLQVKGRGQGAHGRSISVHKAVERSKALPMTTWLGCPLVWLPLRCCSPQGTPQLPQLNGPDALSVLSRRMGIASSSTSSTSAGPPTGTRPPPSAPCSKWSAGWRSGRSSMMGGRDAPWSTACEYEGGVPGPQGGG